MDDEKPSWSLNGQCVQNKNSQQSHDIIIRYAVPSWSEHVPLGLGTAVNPTDTHQRCTVHLHGHHHQRWGLGEGLDFLAMATSSPPV